MDLVRDERTKQLAHFDALDSKAGIVLGFSGLLAAVTPQVPYPWHLLGAATILVAVVGALAAFWPRSPLMLEPTELRAHLRAEPAFTRLRVLDSLELIVNEASMMLARKARRLMVASAALGIATALLTLGMLHGGSEGDSDGRSWIARPATSSPPATTTPTPTQSGDVGPP